MRRLGLKLPGKRLADTAQRLVPSRTRAPSGLALEGQPDLRPRGFGEFVTLPAATTPACLPFSTPRTSPPEASARKLGRNLARRKADKRFPASIRQRDVEKPKQSMC